MVYDNEGKDRRLLKVLTESNPGMRKAIISRASKQFINTLLLCIKRVIEYRSRLSTSDLKNIQRHSNSVTNILRKGKTIKERKKVLQKGGFLSAILPIVGNLLSGLFKQ